MGNPKRPPDEVIGGLATTADKIRALALAGYQCAEIARVLSIRYQHARNVLLQSGVKSGSQSEARTERQPSSDVTNLDASSGEEKSWERLLAAGFSLIGEWVLGEGDAIRLEARPPTEPGVYAFVVDGGVMYVGLTHVGLQNRLDQYRRGNPHQRTNVRVNQLIAATLAEGRSVKILIATPEAMEWHGLPINAAAGLEAALIRELRPAWNVLGAG